MKPGMHGFAFVVLGICLAGAAAAQDLVEAPPAAAIQTAAPAATPEPVAPAGPVYGWKPSVVSQLNLTQNRFDNWGPGGTDTLSWQVEVLATGTDTETGYTWMNTGKLKYGQSQVGDETQKKAADEIRVESVYLHELNLPVKPYAALRFETQFVEGYQYDGPTATAISNFMDPGYLTESLGLGIGDENLRTRLGFAAKQTITQEFGALYADDPSTVEIEKVRSELGMESVTDAKLKLSDIVSYTTQLNLFSNLKAADQIVVRWDNVLSAAVAKYISVNFNLLLVYDQRVSPRRQISQTLAVGLTYSLL